MRSTRISVSIFGIILTKAGKVDLEEDEEVDEEVEEEEEERNEEDDEGAALSLSLLEQ